jgi:hypothetical protein
MITSEGCLVRLERFDGVTPRKLQDITEGGQYAELSVEKARKEMAG